MTGPASTPAPDPGAEPKLEVRWHFAIPIDSKLLDRIALFKTELARAGANGRGKPASRGPDPRGPAGFNEAAANRRGKRPTSSKPST